MGFAQALRPALLGTVLAWAGAGPAAVLMGIGPVFQFRRVFVLLLFAVGIASAFCVAAAAGRLRLAPRAALFLSTVLTFAGFAALVWWIMSGNAEGGRW